MQAKRIQLGVGSPGAGVALIVRLDPPSEPRGEINYHNIWASACMEPLVADANAQGSWVLFTVRDAGIVPTFTDALINAETNNAQIIACGVWCASNQAPVNIMINPKTSRTLNADDSLVLEIFVSGVTTGDVLSRLMLCAHVTRK